ncbi:MAG TPA: HAMP domain-containing protein [Bacteroidetes bacterium]|nr:HAMP domain-containing protein [Bacteroidota bacterium]
MKLLGLKPALDKLRSNAKAAFDRPNAFLLRSFSGNFLSFFLKKTRAKPLSRPSHFADRRASLNFPSILANLTASDIYKKIKSLKLKVKIRIGLVILFAAITLLGMLSGNYVQRTSNNAISMIRDNHRTIGYVMEMYKSMNDMVRAMKLENLSPSFRRQQLRKAADNFETYLNLQLDKVADKKEEELTQQLKQNYELFREYLLKSEYTSEMRTGTYMKLHYIEDLLEDVQQLNERMIEVRTKEASENANQVTLYIVVLGFFFFVFALFAMFYFPHYITEPIENMTQSMQQISQKNYNERLDVSHSDELGDMARSFNIMAEKLEEFENINVSQILTEKRRTETIVSGLNEAIIGLDDRKLILFANPPALDLLGLREHQLIGCYATDLAKKHILVNNLLKEILKDEVQHSTTFPAISIDKNGKRQYFDKDVMVVDSYGEDEQSPANVGFIVILKNVTELKEQDLAKTNFMATLSHELKTPIAAIDMSLNLLADERIGELNEEQKDLAKTIRQNSARLLKMVNEILDISRIESGKLKLTFEEIQPDEVVVKALDNVKTFIAEKHVQVIQNIEADLPKIKADVPKTTAVLVNFLTNALRYTAAKEAIEIKVKRQNGSVEFYVKDRGPGISPADQRKLFQPYRRAKGDKTKGTGLGLAISKEFVEAQGGRIWVKSEMGKGSNFGFAIPVVEG